MKPTTSYVESGGKVEIPRGIVAHHEGTARQRVAYFVVQITYITTVELGVVIGKGGRDILQQNADLHVAGYGV